MEKNIQFFLNSKTLFLTLIQSYQSNKFKDFILCTKYKKN